MRRERGGERRKAGEERRQRWGENVCMPGICELSLAN